MALPSTLHHFDVRLSQVDRGIERDLAIKAARHPSETAERLWLRLIAYCWLWEETIAFGPGISDNEAPDLFAVGPDGATRTLVGRVGRPDLARIEKDCARSGGARVAVLFDSPRRLEALIDEARAAGRPERLARAELAALPEPLVRTLGQHEERRQRLGLTIADDHLYLDVAGETLDGPLVRGHP
jgi:uncharacterized protein YaeQ